VCTTTVGGAKSEYTSSRLRRATCTPNASTSAAPASTSPGRRSAVLMICFSMPASLLRLAGRAGLEAQQHRGPGHDDLLAPRQLLALGRRLAGAEQRREPTVARGPEPDGAPREADVPGGRALGTHVDPGRRGPPHDGGVRDQHAVAGGPAQRQPA